MRGSERVCEHCGLAVFPRAEAVLQFLVEYVLAHGGQSPTYREIGEGVGISSSSVVSSVLGKLEAEGLVLLARKKRSRGVEVVGMKLIWEDPRIDNGD